MVGLRSIIYLEWDTIEVWNLIQTWSTLTYISHLHRKIAHWSTLNPRTFDQVLHQALLLSTEFVIYNKYKIRHHQRNTLSVDTIKEILFLLTPSKKYSFCWHHQRNTPSVDTIKEILFPLTPSKKYSFRWHHQRNTVSAGEFLIFLFNF